MKKLCLVLLCLAVAGAAVKCCLAHRRYDMQYGSRDYEKLI